LSVTYIHPEGRPGVEQDERWQLVVRVTTSRHFVKAPQLREILTYVCHRALADPAAVIKEHEIACNVLGRKPDFNPNEDNIVRVQISHLRKRLDEYFASDGKDEPLQITIPKGAYVPHFLPKPQALAPPAIVRRKTSPVPVLSAVIGVLALLCLYLALLPANPRTVLTPERRTDAQDPLWARLFGGSQPARIVVADSCLSLTQDLLHTDISVDEYASGQFLRTRIDAVPDAGLKLAVQLLAARQYTTLGDTNTSTKLMELSRQFGPNQATLRYARHLNIREFKTGNLILNGSRRGIPWVRLFEPQLNFAMEEDKKTHAFYFLNKSPKPGEQAIYSPTQNDGAFETYADIALLPNLGNTGSVLLLSGISMVDTEAAGELLTRKEAWKELAQILGADTVRDRYFEILVKTRAVAGAVSSSQIVTFRILQPNPSNH
jgi:hypothetical protein